MPSMIEQNKANWTLRKAPKQQRRALYPFLPAILDESTLSVTSTLESAELEFVLNQGRGRSQYLHALYLKAMVALGHSHFQPKDLPRQFRQRVAKQLHLEDEILRVLTIDRREKSHIVSVVRPFLELSMMTPEELESAIQWLRDGLASKEGDIAVLISAVIERFRVRRVEIPPFNTIKSIAQSSLDKALAIALATIEKSLGDDDGERLDTLLTGKEGKTSFDFFKNPVPQATANNLAKELRRIERLRSFLPAGIPLKTTTRHHQEQFAELARRYTAPELAQLNQSKRRALILCYLVERHAFLLDTAADMFIRVWDHTKQSASDYANTRLQAMASAYESHQNVLSTLLSIIKRSRDPEELWISVHKFKSPQEYDGIQGTLENTPSWNALYLVKIEDHYSALRRFLPDWYRLISLEATTTDDVLPRAQAFVREHATSTLSELPIDGCPTEFLKPPWENRAVKRYTRTGRIVRILKTPYEFGLLEATAQGLKNRTVAIFGSRNYASMIVHLIPREEFLSKYDEHVRRLGHPASAAEYYTPLYAKLEKELLSFDQYYQASADNFWVSNNGTLGFSRVPGQTYSPRLKRVKNDLAQAMPEVSILDVLLDCQRWTGFMDAFKPASGRQNMSEEERLHLSLATLYAYGCNCGPIQASRALQIQKNQIVYMRRRYMPTQNLMEAAAILAQAYQQTSMAERLGEMNVLLTDSMQMRTIKDSMIARQHHRYLSGKSTLLYQHVTSNCVCVFTQALLCNVSEAIHMLTGVMECRTGDDSIINICDSAGKSNLVFGLSGLINILLHPRVRSRHLKLWGIGKNVEYKNIADAITGHIRLDRIDKGWQDVMWILASIEAGTGKPLIILNHLASQPQHPATQALEELGKLERSLYLLRYGKDLDLRRFVVPYTSRREHWNKFTGEVQAFGDLIREKTLEDQEEVFWFLTVIQNAIVLWNALSLENILSDGSMSVTAEDLKHILPTMTEHLNFVGKFDVDLQRTPLFDFLRAIHSL